MSRIDIIGQNGNDGVGSIVHYNTKHGHAGSGRSPTHMSWTSMKQRCHNKASAKYENYGGRGIDVCADWADDDDGFVTFLLDMGERPEGTTLDRKDVDGMYCVANCRWATATEQARNKTSTVYITYNKEVLCLAEAQEKSGLARTTFYRRYYKGLRGEALFKPTVHMYCTRN